MLVLVFSGLGSIVNMTSIARPVVSNGLVPIHNSGVQSKLNSAYWVLSTGLRVSIGSTFQVTVHEM